ncbi:MAG TPA: amidohydrolase family protein [Longimicrobiales bacterium]|nr:amidohydrolase family protein [Longimicrobiales bacterium]
MRDRSRGFLYGLMAVVLAGVPAGVAGQERLAIVGGYLIDGTEGVPVEDAVVLVEGDRITHVGTVTDTEIPRDARVIDANGYTIMPGLSDAHVHTMIVGHGVYDEYFPKYESRFREIMPISSRELLMAGVTSARDLGAPLSDIVWLKGEIEAGRVIGPRLFISGPFLQHSLPGGRGTSYDSSIQDSFRWTVNGERDARRKTRQLIDAGVDLIKVIQIAALSPAERAAIVDEARKAGKHIAVHASTVEEVRVAAEMGAGSIEHMGGRPFSLYPEESVELMASNGIMASVTSVVSRIYDITTEWPERLDSPQLREDLPADVYADVRRSLEFFSRLNYFSGAKNSNAHHAQKVRQLYENGVQLVVGTDSGTPMNFHFESTWQEMALFVDYGIPPMKVISMATRVPALLYGVYRDLGTIEPGKLADIIVVDGNPLRDMSVLRQSNVVHVIKGGVLYKESGAPALAGF